MSNLSNNIQNIEASRSTIEGMDFVAEAADLAKNQILAQSAEAMLVQASADCARTSWDFLHRVRFTVSLRGKVLS